MGVCVSTPATEAGASSKGSRDTTSQDTNRASVLVRGEPAPAGSKEEDTFFTKNAQQQQVRMILLGISGSLYIYTFFYS